MAIFKNETLYVALVTLPAAGAFLDPAFLQATKGFEHWVFYVLYDAAAIGGAPSFRVEAEGDGGAVLLATRADTPVQLAIDEMQGPVATAIGVTQYQIYVRNKGGVDRFRLNVRETGTPLTPGDIRLRFVAATYGTG